MFRKFFSKVDGLMHKIGVGLFFSDPIHHFHSDTYLRHNARRLEHLASLRIPIAGMSVLEVGAGIGDHSSFFIDRNCKTTITEARKGNLSYLKNRYPNCDIRFLDMDNPSPIEGSPFDIVYCYGLLYHLSKPLEAIMFLSKNCKKMLFLETCVSFGDKEEINLVQERRTDPTQAYVGTGCRPTRTWLFKRLQEIFPYVYIPITQPNHEEFAVDWNSPEKHQFKLQRAIFIASRQKIINDMLTTSLIMEQKRHE